MSTKKKPTSSAKKKPAAKKPAAKKPAAKKPAAKKPAKTAATKPTKAAAKAKPATKKPATKGKPGLSDEMKKALASPTDSYVSLNDGVIPPEIRQMTGMKTLSLKGKTLSGFEHLEEMPGVVDITIWDDLDEVPPALLRLKQLRELRITVRNHESAAALGDLIGLEKLCIYIGGYEHKIPFPTWIARLTNLKELELNGGITDIPDDIAALQQLEIFKLGHVVDEMPRLPDGVVALKRLRALEMRVASLDARIGEITTLESLELRDAKTLTRLPAEIGRLTKLSKLVLNFNGLTALPPEIGALVELTSLRLLSNALTTLPPEIGRLTKLKELNIEGNPLHSLPPEIGQLTALDDLKLGSKEGPATLPPEIGELRSLRTLWAPSGALTTLPPEFGGLESLETLYLVKNQITSLPKEIGRLKKLKWFELGENPIRELPPEIEGCDALEELDLTGCEFAQAAYDRVIALRDSRKKLREYNLPRLAKDRPAPPTTASPERLGTRVLEALAKKGLVLQSPTEVPPFRTRTMKGGATYLVPEAMRQFIFDVQWPKGVTYDVKFGAWEIHGLNFNIVCNLDEYECSYNHPLDGVTDNTGSMLVWDLTDPDPTDPKLYRVDHEGWSDHHPMSLGARLSDLVQKMRPRKA